MIVATSISGAYFLTTKILKRLNDNVPIWKNKFYSIHGCGEIALVSYTGMNDQHLRIYKIFQTNEQNIFESTKQTVKSLINKNTPPCASYNGASYKCVGMAIDFTSTDLDRYGFTPQTNIKLDRRIVRFDSKKQLDMICNPKHLKRSFMIDDVPDDIQGIIEVYESDKKTGYVLHKNNNILMIATSDLTTFKQLLKTQYNLPGEKFNVILLVVLICLCVYAYIREEKFDVMKNTKQLHNNNNNTFE